MRKTLTLLGVFILTTTLAIAQGFGGGQEFGGGKKYDPVQWSGEVEKVSDTEYILHYDAKIQKKWHVYSQFTPEDGPIPLHFEFLPESNATYVLDGKAEESPTIREYSDIFEVDEVFWKDTARLSQKIKRTDASTSMIKSIVKHQSCIENGVCINQEFYVVHDLEKQKAVTFTNYKAFEAYGAAAKDDISISNTSNFGGGQKYDPVKWSGSVEKTSDETYLLNFDAIVENGWYIYAQSTPAGLPLKLEFEEEGNGLTLIGKAIESETKTSYDDIFEEDVIKYVGNTPRLSQKVTTKSNEVASVISYQVCKEVCIQQTFYIIHDLQQKGAKVFSNYKAFEAYQDTIKTDKSEVDASDEEDSEDNKGLWSIFLIAFISGFAVLLTPCVFPMIPMTVSFFTKQSKDRASGIKNAIIYGISIIVIYTVLGTVISILFGSNFMYELSTGPIFNFVFFVIILVFAISFLGAFEIMLPNSLVNKVDNQANRGGYIGIFFMALALAIVSFSCTFPIAGTALVDAATKGGIAPIISMLGFSLAIALPFTLFAIFPGWLNSLPKSGGWLNSVKVFLGFLELAFAFKFLSNVDLVLEWHFLSREVFIAIWIAIFGALALYLFGKLKLPHDSDLKHISVGRLLLGLTTLAFTIYLIPGLWGAPLQLISGFPPPQHSHSESPFGVGYTNSTVSTSEGSLLPEGASYGPHKIISFKDYETGLAYAKKVNKTAMIDFTGVTCQNCRKMEERVWVDPTILNILNQDIVLISLYADDSKKLPKAEQYVSDITGNRIQTYGQKWLEFQQTTYGTNAQPYYVLVDHDGSSLNKPVAYTPNIAEYEAWLKDGITRFNNN